MPQAHPGSLLPCPEVGRVFARFIYTGEIEEDLPKEHALAFLAQGEIYDLQELKSSSCHFTTRVSALRSGTPADKY